MSEGSTDDRNPKKGSVDGGGSGSHFALIAWLLRLKDHFGWRLLATIFCTHHLLKGFAGGGGSSGLIGSAMEFTFRNYGATGPELQVYMAVALLPWSMKATTGLMSDGFPLMGYRKSSYLALFAFLAFIALLLLGLGGGGHGEEAPALPLQSVITGLFLVFFQMALADLLVEAKYSESVKSAPEHGPDLITFVWAGIQLAGLAATVSAGWVIEAAGPSVCYLIAAPFSAAVAWPALRNYLQEDHVPGPCLRPDAKQWKGEGFVPFVLAIVAGSGGLILAASSVLLHSLRVKFIVAAIVGFVNLASFSIFIRPSIARINAFFFLQNAFHIGTHGASFYFFTDTASQYPDGPHFSTRFFVTTMGSVASIFSLIGMLCYNRFAKGWKYRSILVSSSLAFMVVNCLSAIVFLRWNRKLGIPDGAFMVASSAMQSVIGQLSWMPCTVMLAQLCPDGLESTMYALLAGSLNLGASIANYAGAFILEELEVNPRGADGEGAQFDNLWLAALMSALGPCVPLLLVRVLVPDASQLDRLLDTPEGSDSGDCSSASPASASATAGSLFEQWQRRSSERKYETLPTKVGGSPARSSSADEACSPSFNVELGQVRASSVGSGVGAHSPAASSDRDGTNGL